MVYAPEYSKVTGFEKVYILREKSMHVFSITLGLPD